MTDARRRPLSLAAGLVASLLLGECASAAAVDVKQDVHIGLPGGVLRGAQRRFWSRRTNAWAPVYIPLEASEAVTPGAFQVVVESTDSDEVPFRIAQQLPALQAGEKRTLLAYVPPSSGTRFAVTLRDADGKVVKSLVNLNSSAASHQVIEPHGLLYLTLGSTLSGLATAITPPGNDKEPGDPEQGVPGFTVIQNADELPDRWYGYDAADMITLATSNEPFLSVLERDERVRSALLEWVRRGGRLVVCVGRNAALAGRLLEKLNVDCAIKGKGPRKTPLTALVTYSGRDAVGAQQKWPSREIEVAHLIPGPSADVLVQDEPTAEDLQKRPLVVQTSCGSGRVIVVAVDLDSEPFTVWAGQPAFWKKVQAEFAPRAGEAQRIELAANLQQSLETFGEVPVISFGWVALFLLGYIALVGPIDYFILKKVFKRLELTWITFPIVVIAVSVIAYLGAYSSKGSDLWTNKVDLVDIDLHGGAPQVQGTTWWSVFNPRSQSFTVGLEPAVPGWFTPAGDDGTAAPATVSLLETPSHGVPGSPGLFRRAYEYAGNATGVRDVPVPVWATRTFTSSWRVPLSAKETPPIEADLRLSRDGTSLTGTLVNDLPVELQGATLIYRGKLYPVGSLMHGQPLEVSSLFEGRAVKPPISEWDHNDSLRPQPPLAADNHRSLPRAQAALSSYLALKPALFFSPAPGAAGNSGLRSLDQAWRIMPLVTVPTTPQMQYRAEAILVARVPSVADSAEAVTGGPASPSRLWLGALPGGQSRRPALDGFLSQETYIRVFIPVRKDR
jgi:hypothetical protein